MAITMEYVKDFGNKFKPRAVGKLDKSFAKNLLVKIGKIFLFLLTSAIAIFLSLSLGVALNTFTAASGNQLTIITLSFIVAYFLELKKSQGFWLLFFGFIFSFLLLPSQTSLIVILVPFLLKKLKLMA